MEEYSRKGKGVVLVMDDNLIKMRDTFRGAADIIDELLDLEVREASGEDVTKDTESVTGRFMYKMMEMQSLSNK